MNERRIKDQIIYGGPESSSPRLAQLCAPRSPGNPLQVSSTGNTATVRFKTDAYVSGKGFNATWHEITGGCGGVFQASSGDIHSPNYPRPYDNNTECSWVIRVDFGHRVFLNFTDFDIESHYSCNYDSVSVYDGPNSDAQTLGVLCGRQLPRAITSTQNTMFVRLRSDHSNQHRGFSARFTEGKLLFASETNVITTDSIGAAISSPLYPANYPNNQNCTWIIQAQEPCRICSVFAFFSPACGGTLHMETGAFNSPSYPENYPANTECVWNILSSPGNRLQLSFITFSLQESDNCAHDYLEIREGNDTGTLKGRFCGNSLPSNITSIIGHILWIKFVSDGSTSGSGFRTTFSHLFGNNLGGTHGQIASPLWPRNYPHHSIYTWKINVESAQIIQVRILEIDIEDHASCYFDKLRVYDGPDTHFHLIGTYCGVTPSPSLFSSGSSMTVQFLTDNSVSKKGFLLEWSAIEASTEPLPTIAPGACGGILMTGETPSFFFSPGWPNNYASHLVCTWVIRAPESTVELNILAVDLEKHRSCNYDKLVIRDGDNNNSTELVTICGREIPGPIRSSGDNMFIRFTSDGSASGGGFNASYHKGCGGYLHADRGVITSHNFPQHYTPNLNCTWHVVVTSGFTIATHLDPTFRIPNNDAACSSGDYIELKNGIDESSPPLGSIGGNGRFCGSNPPSTMHTTDNELFVHFISDNSNEDKGFKLQYEAQSLACGGNIYVSNSNLTGSVTSPKYPDNYPQNADCVWTITVPNGEAVQLEFQDQFDIEHSTNCSSSYLELRDGADSNKRLIAKLCGNTLPVTYKSLGTVMYLRFRSDNSTPRKGFKAVYSIGMFARSISSYTTIYPVTQAHCLWRREGVVCNVHLEKVYNGFQQQSPIVGKLCGNVAPDTEVRSSGNTMKVRFVTDGAVSSGGFIATYTSLEDADCGGSLLESIGGNFTSPGYDGVNNYTKNVNCEWVIQNPNTDNSSTYISFQNLRLENHQNCQNDFLEFRFDNADGDLITRLCGRKMPSVPLAIFASQIWVHFVSNSEVEDIGFHANYSFTGCGGIQTGETGVLASPNFPQPYSSMSHCAWLLEAPEGHTITLSFAYFDVEYHSVCRWDSVTIMNGASRGSPLIGQYCGTTSPGTIQSGSNKLLVIFNSDHSLQGGGFYANWTSDSLGCGGYIHADYGNIKSPGWPQNFPPNSRCSWTIQTHESSHLQLVFDNNFQIPDNNGHCQRSYVKIWSGADEREEAMLATGCGDSAPAPVVSPNSMVTITFQSQDTPGSGFSASFISRCGSNFTKSSGRIVSPNYPNKYNNNLNCTYTIHTEADLYIILTFQTFELESSSSCSKDGIKIFSDATASRVSLASLCGDSVPAPVSIKGSMSINFYTNSDTTMHGFMASYRVIPCGGTFNTSSGIIRSPTHGYTSYHNNMNCTYHITVQGNKIVELKFNQFDLEVSSSCLFDYVTVYDGWNISSALLGKFCGKALPPVLRSSSNNLFLVFRTDSLSTAGGWRASFRQTLGPQQGCGGYLNSATGNFFSPDSNVDGKYDNNLDCVWNIVAPVDKQINLTFTAFSLETESSGSCRYDFVKVFDGSSINNNLQGTFCGSNTPAHFLSTSNFLTVWFFSDSTVERAGFNATYAATDILCGGIYNATSTPTTTTSPNFPNSYLPFTTCIWTIDAPEEEHVKLGVQAFNLQPNMDCSENSIELKDSPVGDRGQVHRFCGAETFKIPEFYSSGRTAVVTFKSQEYIAGNGFSFTYQIANCSREYNQTFGYLKSPGWPDNYPHNSECIIILRAPQNHTISLFFNAFNLETYSSCNDFLEVRNGSDFDSPVIGKYCGTNLPNPIFPKKNVLRLFFKSDIIISHHGYEITWTSSPTGCGGTLYGDHGSFTSPGYPGSYSNNTHCEWTIVAPLGKLVQLNFATVSIDDPGDCEKNYLKIYNGPNISSPSLRHFCGMDTNIAPLNCSSHQVFITFHAEYVTLPSGFRLTWTS
ncbi:hypothetical protein FKM82_007053 [Ascaphus truei]